MTDEEDSGDEDEDDDEFIMFRVFSFYCNYNRQRYAFRERVRESVYCV